MANLRDAVKAHIESQSCTLYGRAFDIVRSDSREACIDWMTAEIEAINQRSSLNGHLGYESCVIDPTGRCTRFSHYHPDSG